MDNAPHDTLASLDVRQLAQRCAVEQQRYHQRQPSDDRYCLELFQRAIHQDDDVAWTLLYEQFNGTLLLWVRQHPCATLVLAREEPETFARWAYSKFWTATHGAAGNTPKFPTLSSVLSYLKSCLHSTVMDYVRWLQAHPSEVSWEDVNPPRGDDPSYRDTHELWALVERALPDRRERRLVYLLFVQGMKPREVVRTAPQEYPTAQEVYRLSRNILDRLRRNPLLLGWLEEQRKE